MNRFNDGLPLPPEVLADALQDPIHAPSGQLLGATPVGVPLGPVVSPYDKVTRAGLTRIARTVLGANARCWVRKGQPDVWQLGLEYGSTKRVLCEAPTVRALAEAFLAPVRDYVAGGGLRPVPKSDPQPLQPGPGTTSEDAEGLHLGIGAQSLLDDDDAPWGR